MSKLTALVRDWFMVSAMVLWQLLFPIAAAQPAFAVPPTREPKILICHSTQPNPSQGGGIGPQDNPYVDIEVDQSAADGVAGNQQGNQPDHFGEHNGPLFVPDTNQDYWGDIIPPIPGIHGGLNWTTEGQAIWENDCEIPETEPEVGSIKVDKEVDADGDDQFEGGNTAANLLGFRWGLDGGTVNRNMGTTAGDLDVGTHSVTENINDVSGYDFVGWYDSDEDGSCLDPDGTTLPVSVTVVEDETRHIVLCNQIEGETESDEGNLQVLKQVDEGQGGFVEAGADSDFKWGLDAGANNRDMGTTAEDLAVGTHDVDENDVDGYDFVGWFVGEGNCNNPQNSDSLPATVDVEKDQTTVVTLCNEAEDEGKVELCHATESDEKNPYVLIEISPAGAFNGHLDDDFGGTHGDHQNGEDIIPPFEYKGQTYSQNWDSEGQAIFRNGCNVPDEEVTAQFTLTKSNNRPDPVPTGTDVTYTLTLTVPEDSVSIDDVCLTDLPPEEFNYISGSWTAASNAPGHDVAADVSAAHGDDCGAPGEPNYGSPGQWFLGNLAPGEIITLTYRALISNIVSPGNYPDSAFASGVASGNIFANVSAGDSTPFVGTNVSVINLAANNLSVGLSTLPNTSVLDSWLMAILPSIAVGAAYFGIEKRRLQKGGRA